MAFSLSDFGFDAVLYHLLSLATLHHVHSVLEYPQPTVLCFQITCPCFVDSVKYLVFEIKIFSSHVGGCLYTDC